MAGKLKDKVAIVTGAGRGLGRSIAMAYAEEGASVVLVSRTESELKTVAEKAAKHNVPTLPLPADLTDEKQVKAMVTQTLERFGRIDVLMNNAGVSGPKDFITDIQTKDWDLVLNTNLKAVFFCCREALPQMIKQKDGNIINMTSGAGSRTRDQTFLAPTRSLVYSVSKFGLEGFTKALAAQVNRFNINVNALGPSPTDTKGQHKDGPAWKQRVVRQPDQIKKVAVFLACQGRLGITGESIYAPTWDKIYLNRDADI